MKKIIVLFMCLALMSLACLQTAMVASGEPTAVSIQLSAKPDVEPTVGESGLEGWQGDPAPTRPAEMCARVIAIKALHLRASGSDKAVVVAWLGNGDVVQVKATADPDWWFVEYAGMMGYARAAYLEAVECE